MRPLMVCVVALALSACASDRVTDTTCNLLFCQVEGVDLAVVSVDMDSALVRTYSTPIVRASSMRVRFVVVNRGSATSTTSRFASVGLFGETTRVALPPIGPGDSTVQIATMSVDRKYLLYGVDLETGWPIVELNAGDRDPSNDIASGTPVALDLPFMILSPVLLPRQTVRLGEIVDVSFFLYWGHIAGAQPDTATSLVFCVRRDGRTCTEGNWLPLRRVEATRAFSSTLSMALAPAALAFPRRGDYELLICMVPRSYKGAYVDLADPDHHCVAAGQLTVVI